MENKILLSVIIPIYNEEKHIEDCIVSLLHQQFDLQQTEFLLVDGNSEDNTWVILENLRDRYPQLIRLLKNPKRIQSAAMNLGVKNARGEIIMRVDAHAEYPDMYFQTCVELLNTKGAENVGCACETKAHTPTGKLIALMLSSSFAVGGSSFRVGAQSGYTDTVPFGTFRKAFYEKIGGFDERLKRNEDNEINYRIRQNGGKIYMCNELKTTYYCRETVKELAKMAYANGKWNIIAAKLCPGSMSIKYFVPLAFALSLVFMPLFSTFWKLFGYAFAFEIFLYFALAVYASLSKTKKPSELFKMIWLYPAFHIPYGVGSVAGIWDVVTNKYKKG